jgi:hypothetical protein
VILRGDSFDQSLLDDLGGRIFLVNWENKVGRKNVYYATGDQNDALSFEKKGMFSILYVWLAPTNKGGEIEEEQWRPGVKEPFEHTQNVHIKMGTKFNISSADTGSGIAIISVVMRYTDELQVHGWDHYLNSSPKKRCYLRKLFGMLFS